MSTLNPVSGQGLSGGLLSLFDASYTSGLLVPHYLKTLKNKYGDNGLSDFQLLMGLGMKRGVQNITGWHWEKGFYDSAISGTVATVTGGNSTATITVAGQTSGGSIDTIYAKVGQVVMLASEDTLPLARVTDVQFASGSNWTVTIEAIETGSLSVIAATDAVTLIVVGSAWAEGTDQPTSSQSFWTKYNWQTQIFKETYELTGTQKTNAPQFMEVEYGDGKSKKMNGFFYEGQDEAEYRLIKQIALSMIFGKKNTNTSANIPQTFSGLDAEIGSRGYTAQIGAAAGSFDVADLRTIATEMSKRYSSNLFLTWLTQELYSELNQDANSTGYFGNANVNALNSSIADVFFGGDMSSVDALTGTLSFQGLIVDGYNFMLKQARFMQDPTTMAASGAVDALRRRGWVIPLNKMADAEGVLRNRIELVYKEMNGYSRFMEITDDGRASARKIGPTDVARLYLSSDLGFDFFVLEQFTKLVPTGV